MQRFFVPLLLFLPSLPHLALAQGTLYYDPSIKVYRNGHQLRDPWAGGQNAAQLGMIDLNGDNNKDLVTYDRTSGMTNTYLYKNGYYIYSPEYRNSLPADLYGFVVFRDYNHDGLVDIFTNEPQGLKAYRNVTVPGGTLEFIEAASPVYTLTTSGRINLQVNYTDIPAIDDVDGDGDLDVLVYNFAIGKSIRYHRNLSMEKYGIPDSLDFELMDKTWGQFDECQCHEFAFTTLGQTCESISGRTQHIGGKSLLLIDMNGDGVMDLLEGHELCNELYFFPNTGTRDTALMTSFSEYFPDTAQRVWMPEFPAGYYDEFENHGPKDLVVSPNNIGNLFKNIDYRNSVWLYRNWGENNRPDFRLEKKNFLQGEMIDVGENASPVLGDIDGNTIPDLLIAGNGHRNGNAYYGYVTYYKNTGTATDPEFVLADSDYLNLSGLRLYDLFISLADLNNDRAEDLFVSGTNPSSDSIVAEIIFNTAGRGQPMQFDQTRAVTTQLPMDKNDTPCFTDVDGDGRTDMLLGKNTGRLDYYRNAGRGNFPDFVLEQNDFLGIIDSYVEFRRNLVPLVIDLDLDGKADLMTSDYQGDLFVYWDYRNRAGKEQLLFKNPLNNNNEVWKQGYQTRLAAGSLRAGNYPVILMGNKQGGISLYRQEPPRIQPDENRLTLRLYPNPAINEDVLVLGSNQDGRAIIYSMLGRPMSGEYPVTANVPRLIRVSLLPPGIYILRMTDIRGRHISERFIINR